MSTIDNAIKTLSLEKVKGLMTLISDLKGKFNDSQDYNSEEYINTLKEINKLTNFSNLVSNLQLEIKSYSDALEMIDQEDFKEIADQQIISSELAMEKILGELSFFTQKPLPNDDKKSIFEIRPGVGGIEAALFSEELLKMYLNYLKSKGINVEIFSLINNPEGGINEATFLADVDGGFGMFRFEGGVHRVQRVPKTEAMGRIHTSTVSVVIVPKFDEKSMNISASEIRIDVYRSSGPGGQSVNTTDSAVRITHIPTGIIVTCQNGKSQHKNKEMAMAVLYGKLQDIEETKKAAAEDKLRKESVENSDRSSKIRTYNFPQSRITDHRINTSWFNITEIMNGDLEEIINTTSNILRGND